MTDIRHHWRLVYHSIEQSVLPHTLTPPPEVSTDTPATKELFIAFCQRAAYWPTTASLCNNTERGNHYSEAYSV